jgi:tartrate dehydratase beta subunit/fumarate hydratase class I family protein
MDSYVAKFQENGGSLIMLAKGNRSKEVTNACKKFGGFYLGIYLSLFFCCNWKYVMLFRCFI